METVGLVVLVVLALLVSAFVLRWRRNQSGKPKE
jgi:hypothetical protein